MSEISEYLNQFKAVDSPFEGHPWASENARAQYERVFLLPKLREGIAALESVGKGGQLLAGLMRRASGGDARDKSVLVTTAAASSVLACFPAIETFNDLANFAGANVVDAERLLGIISPDQSLDIGPLRSTTYAEIKDRIQGEGYDISTVAWWKETDREYKMLTDEALDKIMQACPSQRLQYRADQMDCDDYTRVMRGWLASVGLGNCTVGNLEFHVYGSPITHNTLPVGAHSMGIVVTETRVAYLEPQDMQLKAPGYSKFFPGGGHEFLTFIEF